jgi:pimeloyl-ACP methyl ester carboxylesterase
LRYLLACCRPNRIRRSAARATWSAALLCITSFPDSEGFAWLPEDDFLGHFVADIDPVKAKVMYAVQQPPHMSTFDDAMGTPAWKSLPSWYLVAQNDEVIPPDAERQFAQRMGADTIEVGSGHCAMVSHPDETHERIAANAV